MSRPRYDWWPYVKGMIRRYPAMVEEYRDLHSPNVTASYSGMPGGGSDGRTLENLAIRELPSTRQREFEAVRRAIHITERMRSGGQRLQLIRLVLLENRYTLRGAALSIPISYDQAQNYHRDFIYLVAKCYGLLDQ